MPKPDLLSSLYATIAKIKIMAENKRKPRPSP
jgi:hypothetical protein